MNPKNMPGPGDLGGPPDYDEFEDYCPGCNRLHEDCICVCPDCGNEPCSCIDEDCRPCSINVRGER